MRIELVTIGNELLLGFTTDTNAAHLARELGAVGIEMARRCTVGDDADEIGDAVKEALDRTGAVLTTGGLGPTEDDVTREAVARAMGRALHEDPEIVEQLQRRWRGRGLPGELPANNRKQAQVPDGATVLDNRHGSAPGLWVEDDRRRFAVLLPGVPRELREMLADAVIPRLIARLGAAAGRVIRSRTLRITGMPESMVSERIASHGDGKLSLPLAYLPGVDGVDLRLTAYHMLPADADLALDSDAAVLRRIMEPFVYGEGSDDLAGVVQRLCRRDGLRIAAAESCTGGLLAARLTAVPGSSEVMEGGVVAYDDRVKMGLLNVDEGLLRQHGAVSESVAVQMATGVRRQLQTDIGVSITGVAGPGGGTADKPVGTVWIGTDIRGKVQVVRSVLGGDRAEIRWRATQAALELIRRQLDG